MSVVSALTQDRIPQEVVIGVDSRFSLPPDIHRRLERLARVFDVPLVILNNVGSGAASVRAGAISVAAAEHVALLDDDDIWFKQHLSRALQMLKNDNLDLYCARAVLLVDGVSSRLQPHRSRAFPGGEPLSRWFYDKPVRNAGQPAGIPSGTVVLKTRVARGVSMDSRLAMQEDFAWLIDIQTRGGSIRQYQSVDLLIQRQSSRSNARVSGEQSLIYAHHLEANSSGMGVRYLAYVCATFFGRRRLWGEVATIGAGLQSFPESSRHSLLLSSLVRGSRFMAKTASVSDPIAEVPTVD
jgi:hypothetical protein